MLDFLISLFIILFFAFLILVIIGFIIEDRKAKPTTTIHTTITYTDKDGIKQHTTITQVETPDMDNDF